MGFGRLNQWPQKPSTHISGKRLARQLRIDYPGAFYHVYSRGNQKQDIFINDEDRYYFLKVMGDACSEFYVRFHAYCLMPNHYHFLIEAVLGKLSRALHLINTAYTVYLNKKHSRCGHLFQGRFKSILVEAESYARELSRYIHLNPVRAGIVRCPEDYVWSSYQEFMGIRSVHSWLDTSLVFRRPGVATKEERSSFERFVLAGIGVDPPPGYSESKRSGILGSASFKSNIQAAFFEETVSRKDREKPQLKFFLKHHEMGAILSMAEEHMGQKNRFTKGVAILICQQHSGHSLDEIGAFFDLSLSGLYSARRRIKKEMLHNDALANAVQRIRARLCETGGDATTLTESNEK